MATSVLLHGPQGSGKSTIAQLLARHYRLHLVIEHDCDRRKSWAAEGVLLIATHPNDVKGFNGRHVHINEALSVLGFKSVQDALRSTRH